MARKKKKVVHWSKLPRTELIAMVKRLQSEKTKLQLQLSQARETKLLNNRVMDTAERLGDTYLTGKNPLGTVWLRDVDGSGSLHPCAKGDPGAAAYGMYIEPDGLFATQEPPKYAGATTGTNVPTGAEMDDTFERIAATPQRYDNAAPFPWEKK